MNIGLVKKISEHKKDVKFEKLFNYVARLNLQNINGFQETYISFFKELNSLFEVGLINNELYDEYIHDIGGEVTLYLRENESKELLYFCLGCEKYFLEKDGNNFKTELKTKQILEYATPIFCSYDCSQKYNLNKIVVNPSQILNNFKK